MAQKKFIIDSGFITNDDSEISGNLNVTEGSVYIAGQPVATTENVATALTGLVLGGGPKGETGDAGPQGETGDAGPQGETGDAGPQGIKGETGDAGPQGIKGETGDAGPVGLAGPAGAGAITTQQVSATTGAVNESFDNITTLQFDDDSAFEVTNPESGVARVSKQTFKYWQVDGEQQLAASGLDTVNFIAGDGISITGDGTTEPKSIRFDVTGSGSGGGGGSSGPSPTWSYYDTPDQLPLSGPVFGSKAYVSSVNSVYLWSGYAWFVLALVNTPPSISSTLEGAYFFQNSGEPIVLTLNGTDPEEVPLTWNYQVVSGTIGDTATVVKNGNVFTITPSTDPADDGEFVLAFSATDGINLVSTPSATFQLRIGKTDWNFVELTQTLELTDSYFQTSATPLRCVVSADGNTMVAASPWAKDITGVTNDCGRVSVFERNPSNGDWSETAVLFDPTYPSVATRFGMGLEMNPAGTTIYVGAPRAPSAADAAQLIGAVYVLNKSGSEWILEATLRPTGTDTNNHQKNFGGYFHVNDPYNTGAKSIAVSGDTLVVSQPDDSTFTTNGGAVHIFRRTLANDVPTWTHEAKLTNNYDNNFYGQASTSITGFGNSVAIDGDTLAVSVPKSGYFPIGTTTGDYTTRNSTNTDYVNTPTRSGEAGTVVIYKRTLVSDVPTWTFSTKLHRSSAVFGSRLFQLEHFGISIDLRGDQLIVGASGIIYNRDATFKSPIYSGVYTADGAVFVFRRTGNTVVTGDRRWINDGPDEWVQEQVVEMPQEFKTAHLANFGRRVKLSPDGESLAITAPNLNNIPFIKFANTQTSGATFVYIKAGGKFYFSRMYKGDSSVSFNRYAGWTEIANDQLFITSTSGENKPVQADRRGSTYVYQLQLGGSGDESPGAGGGEESPGGGGG